MGSLSDMTLGDLARALGRYKPVLLTVAGILLLVAVSPGPRRVVGDALAGVPGPVRALPAAQDEAVTEPTTEPGAEAFAPDDGALADGGSSSFSSAPSTFGPSTSGASSDFTSDDDDAGGSSSPEFSGSDSGPSTSGDSSFSGEVTSEPSRPLRVVASATASSGTTGVLPGSTPPAGTLPVGKRFGQDDKYSYVRLSGDETTLSLSLEPTGSRTTSGATSVVACRVTRADWPEGENKPLTEIPFDRTQCRDGVRDDAAGAYRFDLSAFGDRTDNRGFALVPAPGSSVDFQVNFRKS